MAKKPTTSKGNSQIDNSGFDMSQFEVVHSGSFSPIWKPLEKDEYVVVNPVSMRAIEVSQGKGAKKITKKNYLLEALLVDTNTLNFFSAKTRTEVMKGDTISVPISYGLVGKTALAVHVDEEDEDSPMEISALAQECVNQDVPLCIKFLEKASTKNGQSVKRFTVLAPKGIKEKVLKS